MTGQTHIFDVKNHGVYYLCKAKNHGVHHNFTKKKSQGGPVIKITGQRHFSTFLNVACPALAPHSLIENNQNICKYLSIVTRLEVVERKKRIQLSLSACKVDLNQNIHKYTVFDQVAATRDHAKSISNPGRVYQQRQRLSWEDERGAKIFLAKKGEGNEMIFSLLKLV